MKNWGLTPFFQAQVGRAGDDHRHRGASPPSAERRLEVQDAATRVLAQSGSVADAAPRILAGLSGTLGWELGAVWCVDRASSRLRCTAVWHADAIDADAFKAACDRAAFPVGIGIPGRAWAEGGPIW